MNSTQLCEGGRGVRLSLRHDARAMETLRRNVLGWYAGTRTVLSHFCVGVPGNADGPLAYPVRLSLLQSADEFTTSRVIADASVVRVVRESPLFCIRALCFNTLRAGVYRREHAMYVFLHIAAAYTRDFTCRGYYYEQPCTHATRTAAGMVCTPLEELCG